MQKIRSESLKNKPETKTRPGLRRQPPAPPRYFSITLKTIDIDSLAWHRLTDPLIDHYRLHMETPEAEVIEIKETHDKTYREYAAYLLEFIHAAHDGEIDLMHEDPLSFDEWKVLDAPSHPHQTGEMHADA